MFKTILNSILACTFGCWSFGAFSQTVPNKDWIKYFSQRGNLANGPTAIDANNNMYLTGYTGTTSSACNILTQKRDSLGNLIYSAVYNNGNYDRGNAIRLGGTGVFVAGVSHSGSGNNDYIVLHYNHLGVLQWQYRFDNAADDDEAMDLKVDGSQNVYVTGKSKNSNGDYDIVTLKLSASGTLLWSHSFNGTSGLNDEGTGLTLAGAYVYITGISTDPVNGADMLTYQLDANTGVQGWSSLINGSGNGNDRPYAIIASGADVLVCGELDNGGADAILARLDGNSGAVVYQRSYDYNGAFNKATSMVRDAFGNVALVGPALAGGVYEYHTVLYDSAGVQLWVNRESTGLGSLSVEPRIARDTIANHFYVCGEILKTSKDIFVYQLTPGGNTQWRQSIDGQNSDIDAATGLAVNGAGVVYVGALSRNTGGHYDYTAIRVNQTPVYFPPDLNNTETPSAGHLYYENKGQIVAMGTNSPDKNILFSTMEYFYPYSYFATNKISYKLSNINNLGGNTDSIQRIDITMLGANSLAEAYPFEPKHGQVSYMNSWLPDAVVGLQGYERYFIPNIYPSIDLHYYSNQAGIKIYYVLKPFANPQDIQWEIAGANSTAIVNKRLVIDGFNRQIVYEQPNAYTVNNQGQALALGGTATAQWQNNGSYGIQLPPYNNAWPLIIELSYPTNTVSSSSNNTNLFYSTYYGGKSNEGFISVDVDYASGDYVALAEVEARLLATADQFPTVPGSTISISTNTAPNQYGNFMGLVLFDKNGHRKAANTYGTSYSLGFSPLKAVLHNNRITVLGNADYPWNWPLPLYASTGPLTPGAYTDSIGPGFILQFEFVPLPALGPGAGNISKITWRSRLHGAGSDIAKTPNGNHLYVTSLSDWFYGPDTQVETGAYNSGTFINGNTFNYKISKFSPTGIRQWASIWQASCQYPDLASPYNEIIPGNGFLNHILFDKCKIACDNNGFYLAGETDTINMKTYSKYGAPYDSTFNGRMDAFFARFNKQDSLVYSTYLGGSGDDGFKDICPATAYEAVMTGYSASPNRLGITTLPGPNDYVDTTMIAGQSKKMLICKFDTTGHKTWCTFYGSSNTGSCLGLGVTSDFYGKVFVTGKDAGGFIIANPFGAGPVYYESQHLGGSTDAFIVCFNSLNYPIWNTHFGGLREDIGLGTKYNPHKNALILVGATNSPNTTLINVINFPAKQDANYTNAWSQPWLSNDYNNNNGNMDYDGFITFFDNSLLVAVEDYFKNSVDEHFNLFPNPAQNECFLAFKQSAVGASLEVVNLLGQVIIHADNLSIDSSSIYIVDTKSLGVGVYMVMLKYAGGRQSKKLIINK